MILRLTIVATLPSPISVSSSKRCHLSHLSITLLGTTNWVWQWNHISDHKSNVSLQDRLGSRWQNDLDPGLLRKLLFPTRGARTVGMRIQGGTRIRVGGCWELWYAGLMTLSQDTGYVSEHIDTNSNLDLLHCWINHQEPKVHLNTSIVKLHLITQALICFNHGTQESLITERCLYGKPSIHFLLNFCSEKTLFYLNQ